jgi:hypothetical protein
MKRYVVGGAVAALLLTLTGIPSPATAEPSATAQTPTLKVHREYGQRPVTIPSGVDRVLLTFHGRKGDTVQLDPQRSNIDPCITISLRGPSGTVAPWRNNLWRLPARGRYTADYRRCSAEFQDSIQLVKVSLHPLPVNGGSVRLGWREGGAYVDAGIVAVPRRGRVQVRPTSSTKPEQPWSTLYLKGAPRLDIWLWHQEAERSPAAVYLEAGSPIANEQAEMMVQDQALVPQAGQRVILMSGEPRMRVRATRARSVPGTLDGAAVPVAADRRYQEVGVRFASVGDQWVTATVTGQLASRSLRSLALIGPDGRTVVGLDQATMGVGADLWYLPTAGRYRLMARTDPTHNSGRIKLSTVRELDAEMPADGQPLAFTAQKPGEWVLATGQLADEPYQLTAEATGATKWRTFAKSQPFVPCRSSFCDQGTSATLTPDNTTHFPPLHSEGPWIFLVAFGAGQSGTVSLRLTPTM